MGCCDNVKGRLNQTSSYCGWARCPPEPHKLRLPSSSLRIRNHTPKNNKRFLGEETGTQYLHLENLIRAGISVARLRDDPRKPREHCGNVSVTLKQRLYIYQKDRRPLGVHTSEVLGSTPSSGTINPREAAMEILSAWLSAQLEPHFYILV